MNNLFADCDPADPLPSGYAVDHVSRLVLPQRIASALADERLASQVLLAREAQEAGDDARNLSPQGSSDSIGEAAAPVSTRKKKAQAAAAALPPASRNVERLRQMRHRRPRAGLALLDHDRLLAAVQELEAIGGSGDVNTTLRRYYNRLAERGPWRQAVRSSPKRLERLKAVARDYPNAGALVALLLEHLSLYGRLKGPMLLPPVILVGPPGVGKSEIVRAVAASLDLPFVRVQAETSTHASVLVGTESHWSTYRPGLIYDTLACGSVINPLILLDEIEKASHSQNHPGVVKTLFALLEQASAAAFRDLCIDRITLDASHICWMATANTLHGLDTAILSRMRVVHIPPLTAAQGEAVVLRIDAQLRAQFLLGSLPALPAAMVLALSQASPRRMQQVLRMVYGRLVQAGRTNFMEEDLQAVKAELAEGEASGASATSPGSDPGRAGTGTGTGKTEPIEWLLSVTTAAALRGLSLHARLAAVDRFALADPASFPGGWIN